MRLSYCSGCNKHLETIYDRKWKDEQVHFERLHRRAQRLVTDLPLPDIIINFIFWQFKLYIYCPQTKFGAR